MKSGSGVALGEGRRGIGLTAPNPPVGAVVVKDGVEIARGWHHKVGSPHAEKDALSKLKDDEARGATVYVTLEPCSTHGRTGACTEALISAGVSKVVYGACDPNPSHSGEAGQNSRGSRNQGCHWDTGRRMPRADSRFLDGSNVGPPVVDC